MSVLSQFVCTRILIRMPKDHSKYMFMGVMGLLLNPLQA